MQKRKGYILKIQRNKRSEDFQSRQTTALSVNRVGKFSRLQKPKAILEINAAPLYSNEAEGFRLEDGGATYPQQGEGLSTHFDQHKYEDQTCICQHTVAWYLLCD